MATEATESGWKPPYVSYETLRNFIDTKLGPNAMPPRIDKGFLDNYSGGVQPQLVSALKTIGFIVDPDGAVQDLLRRAARSPDERKAVLRDWATSFYSEQIEKGQEDATAQMLWESFARSGYSGSTLRKAIVFYLALVEDLGLPKSPYFKPPRQSSPINSAKRRARVTDRKPDAPPVSPPALLVNGVERKTVSFGAAGNVMIEVNVRWLDLPEDIFTGLRKVVRDLETLGYVELTGEEGPVDATVTT